MDSNLIPGLDEQIIGLIQKRHTMAGGEVGVKEDEPLTQWAKELDLNPIWLFQFLSLMDAIKKYQYEIQFPSVVTLQTVIPVVRNTFQDGIHFCITHVEQYEVCSVLHMVISNSNPHVQRFHGEGIRPPKVQMHVIGVECTTYQTHWRHEGPNIHAAFVAIPRLPEDLSAINFEVSFQGAQITSYEVTETCGSVELTPSENDPFKNNEKQQRRSRNHNPLYNNEFRLCDEEIIKLLKHRKTLLGHTGQVLSGSEAERLAERLDVHPKWLNRYLSAVNRMGTYGEYVEPIGPRNPQGIVYPERYTYSQGMHFRVSQMEQYENCSLVQLDILVDPARKTELKNWSRPRLVVRDSICSEFRSGGGGGSSMRFTFQVAPALPDDLVGVYMAIEFDGPYAYEPTTVEVKSIQM
ncbi:hypothetical protein [Alicyclobacillus dauci]|uniref:Uncharacterized protein n=1 Tax=Alicyclobacillus dauci TaxID=1475485 RepID=A0ABY6Z1K3_9BACL|nr:hypothetical protein [Alicyclobacillus dauci]WAH36609.1 hypothetical protein NZD86_20900 [Alicyclobacillus dauci]